VQVAVIPSSNRWKGPYVYGQKMRHKMIVTFVVVMGKAIWLYNHRAEFWGWEKGNFHASKGWFEKFKKQMTLHNLK
jgi:hypothetical protein